MCQREPRRVARVCVRARVGERKDAATVGEDLIRLLVVEEESEVEDLGGGDCGRLMELKASVSPQAACVSRSLSLATTHNFNPS